MPVAQIMSSEPSVEGSLAPSGRLSTVVLMMSMFAGNIFTALTYDALPPVLAAISAHFGGGQMGDLVAQLASTLPLLGMVVSGTFAGVVIERLGLKTTLLTSLLIYGFAGSIGGVLNSSGPLLASRFILGIMTGLMMTCGVSLLALRYDLAKRESMAGAMFGAGAIFATLFLLLSGLLASISWRAPFAMYAVLAAIFLLPVILGRYPRVLRSDLTVGEGREWRSLKLFVPAIPVFLFGLSVMLLGNLFSIQIAFLMEQAGLGEPGRIASVLMGLAVISALGSLFYGWLSAQIGTRLLVQLIYLMQGAGALILAVAATTPLFVLGALTGGVGIGLGLPATVTLVVKAVPLELAPRASGLAIAALFLGSALAPLAFSPVRFLFGLKGQYVVAFIVCVGGVLLYNAIRLSLGRRIGRLASGRFWSRKDRI